MAAACAVGCAAHRPPTGAVSIPLAPHTARIAARLVAIDPASVPGACPAPPCRGAARVDSLLGMGAAFSRAISPGDTLVLTFTCGLARTPALPGLRAGDAFRADIFAEPVPGGEPRLLVRTYEPAGY